MQQLEASRELDALVAEKVMGATWAASEGVMAGCEWLRMPEDHGKEISTQHELLAVRGPLANGKTLEVTNTCPHYSADIAPAWLVVEKMRERGWFVEINDSVEYPSRTPWWRALFEQDDAFHVELAVTAPLAICAAALAALGAQ